MTKADRGYAREMLEEEIRPMVCETKGDWPYIGFEEVSNQQIKMFVTNLEYLHSPEDISTCCKPIPEDRLKLLFDTDTLISQDDQDLTLMDIKDYKQYKEHSTQTLVRV